MLRCFDKFIFYSGTLDNRSITLPQSPQTCRFTMWLLAGAVDGTWDDNSSVLVWAVSLCTMKKGAICNCDCCDDVDVVEGTCVSDSLNEDVEDNESDIG